MTNQLNSILNSGAAIFYGNPKEKQIRMISSSHFNLGYITTLSLVGLVTLTPLASSDPSPWAENVCNQSTPIKEDKM